MAILDVETLFRYRRSLMCINHSSHQASTFTIGTFSGWLEVVEVSLDVTEVVTALLK